jgi:hypothetical protein
MPTLLPRDDIIGQYCHVERIVPLGFGMILQSKGEEIVWRKEEAGE